MAKKTRDEAIAAIAGLRKDFPTYAPRCLKIVTKRGDIVPFTLNKAQAYIEERAEKQLRDRGYVRMIILKGRQQGASTYITGRLYYKATGAKGKNVGILTHEQKATDNLFTMVRRYHEHCPALVKPGTAADSAKELWFNKRDVRYKISTAGSKGTGRSSTIQYFHGSEVAFWPNASSHLAGIGEAVPLVDGTEVYLESTANGIGNTFYNLWQDAIRGISDYEAVFIPWFWEDGYSIEPPKGFVLEPDEAEYRDAFDLSLGQMAWRRMKIIANGGDVALFNQEYPATPAMAFLAGSKRALISPTLVAEAARPKKIEVGGPLVIGVDPAEYGDDMTGIIVRHGRQVIETHRESLPPMALCGFIGNLIERLDPDAVCIDVTNSHSMADRLIEQGFQNIYKISFGSGAIKKDQYANKRAEMWGNMKDWLEDYPCLIPEHPVLMADLSAVGFTYDSSRRKLLDSKEKMRSEGIPSPDMADALALTFAVPVMPKRERYEPWQERLRKKTRHRNPMAA